MKTVQKMKPLLRMERTRYISGIAAATMDDTSDCDAAQDMDIKEHIQMLNADQWHIFNVIMWMTIWRISIDMNMKNATVMLLILLICSLVV